MIAFELRAARTAADAGDRERALTHLLIAWREARAPQLAEAVERVSAVLVHARGGGLSLGEPADEPGKRWAELEAAMDPADLGVLLRELDRARRPRVRDRLIALRSRPADPRVAAAAMALIERVPYTSSRSGGFWRRLCEVVVAHADPRNLERLTAFAADHSVDDALPGFIRARVSDAHALLRAELGERTHALGPVDADLVASIAAACEAPGDRGERLLAAIHAEPDQLAHRQVYADHLLDGADPIRGEFIALQLAALAGTPDPAAEVRMREIQGHHGWRWLGPLVEVVATSSLRFERGFPVAAEITSPITDPERLRDPRWATFEYLGRPPTALLAQPHLRALRHVRILRAQLPALARGPRPPRLACLELHAGSVLEDPDAHLAPVTSDERAWLEGESFPALDRLIAHYGVGAFELWRWILDGPLARRLGALELHRISPGLDAEGLRRWVTGLRGADARLRRVHLTRYRSTCTLGHASEDRAWDRARVELNWYGWEDEVCELLGVLVELGFSAVEIDGGIAQDEDPRVQAALAELRRAALVTVLV